MLWSRETIVNSHDILCDSVPLGTTFEALCFLELRRRFSLMLYLREITDEVNDAAEKVEKDAESSRASDEQQMSETEAADVLLLNECSRVERQLLRKLDMRFLPTIFLIYLVNYIDKTAITAARLKGLEQDLGLSDVQYDTTVAILYASCSDSVEHDFESNDKARMLRAI
ncbi:hypothetical protein ACEPAF_2895 [Sanghuangporus sanghuang]